VGNLVAAFGPLSTSWLRWVFSLAEDAEQTGLAGKKCANGVYQTSFWECLFAISYAPNTFACTETRSIKSIIKLNRLAEYFHSGPLMTQVIWPYHLSPPVRTGAYFTIPSDLINWFAGKS